MQKLNFCLSKLSYYDTASVIEDMRQWLVDNEIKPATSSTMEWNEQNGLPYRLYRFRETSENFERFSITFSHYQTAIFFKLRWSDYWVE